MSRQRQSISGRNKPDPLSDEITPPNVRTSTQKYKNTGGRVKKHSLGSKSRHQCPFFTEHLYPSLFKVALYCPLVSTGLTCFSNIQDLLHFCMAFHHGPLSLSGSVFLAHSVFLSFTEIPLYPLNKALALSRLLLTLSLTRRGMDLDSVTPHARLKHSLITCSIQTHLLLLCPFKRSVIEVLPENSTTTAAAVSAYSVLRGINNRHLGCFWIYVSLLWLHFAAQH